MAVNYTTTQLSKAYLSSRYQLGVYLETTQTKALTGFPCECTQKEESKILFLLFCLENIDHLTEDTEKDLLISKAMTAGKLATGVVTTAQVTTFEATAKGAGIIAKL